MPLKKYLISFLILFFSLLSIYSNVLAKEEYVWFADFETGDISQWEPEGGWISQDGGKKNATELKIVDNPALGKYSAGLTIDLNARGTSGGVAGYLFRWKDLPNNAYYYSAYYYIPSNIKPDNWWNIFQWKSNGGSRLYYLVNVAYKNGKLIPELHYHFGTPGGGNPAVFKQYGTPINLPTDRWFLLQGYFKQSKDQGEVALFVDDTQLVWDVDGTPKKIIDKYPTQVENKETINWSINNYTDASNSFTPKKFTIYVDNARISVDRIKPLESSNTFKEEDINKDGTVNIIDLVILVKDFGKPTSNYDITGDGKVGIDDILKLLNYLFS